MNECSPGIGAITEGMRALLLAQWHLGQQTARLLGGAGAAALQRAASMRPASGACGCEIPEPCWMPLPLGERCCQLAPGEKGTLCLVVGNGDFRPHSYQFAATGKSAAHVSFSQAAATLGPKERIAVTATFTLPPGTKADGDCSCIDHEALIWVRGCRNHYLRWSIDEVACSKPCCHEVVVSDDPDYVLHWYDHFYVARPCPGVAGREPAAAGRVRVGR
jgi:hypothetical protein